MTTEKTTLPKWTEERTATLEQMAGTGTVSQDTVAKMAEVLETSTRSVSSKLRKLGYDVAPVATVAVKTFSDEETEALAAFVEANSGNMTYGEIAEAFAGGKFNSRQVQGKILSLELSSHVKATPKVAAEKKFTDDEEARLVKYANKGLFLEEIAEKLGKGLNSVRGKALALLRAEQITSIPKQRDKKPEPTDPFEGLDVQNMTVTEIAETTGKTPRGVKTMLTRRGIDAADYKAKVKDEAAE